MLTISEELRAGLLQRGAALVGFCELPALPPEPFARHGGFTRGISIAVHLSPEIVRQIEQGPSQHYLDESDYLFERLDALALFSEAFLKENGYAAYAMTCGRVTANAQLHATPLPHKTLATKAGLGWIGKCALLVTPEYGSAVQITSVLTNAPLGTGSPCTHSLCGACRLCTDACPADASTGRNWKPELARADFFNAHACWAKSHEIGRVIGIDSTNCGRCIVVCPYTRRYLQKAAVL